MRGKSAMADLFAVVVAAAEAQFGVISRPELLGLGTSASWIDRQVESGRLHRMHRGVYSVVPPSLLSVKGRWLAAVLACGDGAVLSHRNAAALWDLCAAPSGPIHVTVPTTSGRRKRPGIAIHRSSTLLPSQTTIEYGIPVTSLGGPSPTSDASSPPPA
ncbi:MAG: type IV toxin-antitoxin system AbiEi family antitoxin domain-containing protein [Solirubrobacterales bacterium]